MKTAQQWFAEYAESHQHPKNIFIHKICVPTIYFSIIAMLVSIDNAWLVKFFSLKNPFFVNWATVIAIPVLIFYLTLGVRYFLTMLVFTAICIGFSVYLKSAISLFPLSLVLFILAWIGQFYGHKLEGKKPSFLKDLVFLLIGPVWVFKKILGKS